MANPSLYRLGVLRLLPLQHRARARELLDAIHQALCWWLIGRCASMAMVRTLTAIGLILLGMPLVLTLSLLAASFSFSQILSIIS